MSVTESETTSRDSGRTDELDVLIVGAGFAGLYQLHRLRGLGFSAKILDAAPGFGGVWYWNCYPGARTDSHAPIFQYSREDLWRDWDFSELFPSWGELREYFGYVDRKLDLSRDIRFGTKVESAEFDEESSRWGVQADDGSVIHAGHVVLCTGLGNKPQIPRIPGLDTFAGECHHTAFWPQEGLDLAGKRVGVLGTGASGVQVVQEAAKVASSLFVFQRTPNLALPMRQRALDAAANRELKRGYPERFAGRSTAFAGFDTDFIPKSALEVSDEERLATYEELWAKGGFHPWLGTFYDVLTDEKANATMYDFWRSKVLARIKDPKVAEKLAPAVPPHPFGVKRPSLEQNYFDVFHQDNVTLVDIKESPIECITPAGVVTADATYELDVLVLATGFDANTGGITSIDIRGTKGRSIKEKWSDGVDAYFGVATAEFPNMTFVYGPQSPAAFCNGPSCAELQGEKIVELIAYMRDNGIARYEANPAAEQAWTKQLDANFEVSLFTKAESWWWGANVPGKKRQMLNYISGLPAYLEAWSAARDNAYDGFNLTPM